MVKLNLDSISDQIPFFLSKMFQCDLIQMAIKVFPHGIDSDYAEGGKNQLVRFDNELLLHHSELTKVFKIDNGVRSTKVLKNIYKFT